MSVRFTLVDRQLKLFKCGLQSLQKIGSELLLEALPARVGAAQLLGLGLVGRRPSPSQQGLAEPKNTHAPIARSTVITPAPPCLPALHSSQSS